MEKSKIAFIPKEDFLITIQQSPVLNKRMLKTLSHEFAVLANSISVIAQKSVRERLALQLIVLREKYKVNFQPGMPVEINISRDDLASIVGTARERAVRILTEFKEAGILGFESIARFFRIFKTRFGFSPSEFRVAQQTGKKKESSHPTNVYGWT